MNVFGCCFWFSSVGCEAEQQYFYSSCGLYPAPLPKNPKPTLLRRIKSKFSFLGKFMARALIDCRIVSGCCASFLHRLEHFQIVLLFICETVVYCHDSFIV